jgi:hypothetical protein
MNGIAQEDSFCKKRNTFEQLCWLEGWDFASMGIDAFVAEKTCVKFMEFHHFPHPSLKDKDETIFQSHYLTAEPSSVELKSFSAWIS